MPRVETFTFEADSMPGEVKRRQMIKRVLTSMISGAVLAVSLVLPASAGPSDDGFLRNREDSRHYILARDAKCGKAAHSYPVFAGKSSTLKDTQSVKVLYRSNARVLDNVTRKWKTGTFGIPANECRNIRNGETWVVYSR